MNKYFFVKHNTTKWVLGTDDKFSAWNFMKPNAQRFNTQEEVDNKLVALSLNKEEVIIINIEIRDLKPRSREIKEETNV